MNNGIGSESVRGHIGCLIPTLTLLASLVSCTAYFEYFFDPCETTVLSTNFSPNQKWSIVVYSVGCGATVPFNTQANLISVGQKFTRLSEQRFLAVRGLHDISIKWPDANTVEVLFEDAKELFDKEDVYLMAESKNRLKIIYKYNKSIN